MDIFPLCSNPEAISEIAFYSSNFQGLSIHIQINCALRDKRIRLTLSGKDCLMPNTPVNQEMADEIRAHVLEFPISQRAYIKMLAQLDRIGVHRWQPNYFADKYPVTRWQLKVARTGGRSISASGVGGYPAEWEQLIALWNAFTRLDLVVQILRGQIQGTLEHAGSLHY